MRTKDMALTTPCGLPACARWADIRERIRFLAATALVLAVACGGQAAVEPKAGQDTPRGSVSGIVLESGTGQPISGAYVAIDHSGDAGGANLERFHKEGMYVTGETDAEGRFKLNGVAFCEQHPFMVSHLGFVRHDQLVALRKEDPDIELRVELVRGAAIAITAVDEEDRPLEGETLILLEAEAGPIFAPMRADWPVLSTRLGRSKNGTSSFGGLPAGIYSLDVMRISPSLEQMKAHLGREGPNEAQAPVRCQITHHARMDKILVEAGESKTVRMSPAGHRSDVTIEIAEDPHTDPEQRFVMLCVSREPGRLLWANRQFFHPEDHRLGRAVMNSLVQVPLAPGQSCQVRNFPPGDYAVFVLTLGRYLDFKSSGAFLRGVKVTVQDGREATFSIPWREPEGVSHVRPTALGALEATVSLESRSYTVPELCELLGQATGSRAQFIATHSLEDQRVTLEASKLSIWEVLERLYLDQGWEVDALDQTFSLRAPHAS